MTRHMTLPVIVAISGSLHAGSSVECALAVSLNAARSAGACVELVCGSELDLPKADPGSAPRTSQAERLLKLISEADGLLLGTPACQGTVSRRMTNALDYVEGLRTARRPYFTGRAIGCLAVGKGRQETVSALMALRTVVHALRGWPTPLGVAVDAEGTSVAPGGGFTDAEVNRQLALMGRQVVEFACMTRALAAATHPAGSRVRSW
ncbi:NADPH-dependent FMN reductase [Streptomyces chartreusis]|uniref:NADPH-dependent FMN reductase n=1 Tax=Streptomyces chartreusis TaxID=1969 RepID=UPI003804736D